MVTKKMAEFMDKRLEEDEELTTTELHQLIVKKFSKKVFAQTIYQFLHQKPYWAVIRTKTGPMTSETKSRGWSLLSSALLQRTLLMM